MGSDRPRLADRLRGPQAILDATHQRLAAGAPAAHRPAAEWLLDNYYIVERAFGLIRDEFPPAFERRLPRSVAGEPIAYALAREIVTASAHHVDAETIARLVARFQTGRHLSMAEIWALPVLLRIVLIESLAEAAAIALPAEGPAGETPADQRVAACIQGLRTLETTDWKAFFEDVSETERILRADPAGVYARMDFDTRDRYRKVIEKLAERTDWSEEAVAREAVRRSGESGGRARHVGYHLIDDGFEALGKKVGYRAAWGARSRRLILRHPTPGHLGTIGAGRLAACHSAGRGAPRRRDRAGPCRRRGGAGPRSRHHHRGQPGEPARHAGHPGTRPPQDGLSRRASGRLPDGDRRPRDSRRRRRGLVAPRAARDPLARQRGRQPPCRTPRHPGRRARGVDAG